ncbi:MAG: O-antigen ligase family protein, partial [Chloroflexota bacterium]
YITIIIELIIFIVVLLAKAGRRVRRGAIYVIGAVVVCSLIVMFASVEEPVEKITNLVSTLITSQQGEEFYMSNVSRFGSQQTAYNIGLDHPIIGVGFGQYGFYMPYYLPDYAYNNPEIIIYASFLDNTAWAPAHGLFARLLAEIGFIGLALFVMIWATFLWSCWSTYRVLNKINPGLSSIGLALILSTLGVLMVGFTADTFRFFGYWFTLAVGWYYFETPRLLKKEAGMLTVRET